MSGEPSPDLMPDWFRPLWWDFWHGPVMATATLGFSLRTEGWFNVPLKGPALVVANHQSFLDPPLLGLASRRRLCFLARKGLFHNPLFAWLIRSFNSVPVDQEGFAREGLRQVLALLGRGEAVVIFPEGERTRSGNILPLRPGIHLLIRKAPVPVVPVGIAGAYEALPRHRAIPHLCPLFWPATPAGIAVCIGKPLSGDTLASLPREQALAEVAAAIQAQFERAQKLRRRPPRERPRV